MIKNVQEIIRQKVDKGLNTYKNFFNLTEGQTPASINVVYNNDGSFGKRLGSSTMNTAVLESTAGYGMYDFGVLGAGGNDSNANLLLHFDGSPIVDSSRRVYSITTYGDIVVSTLKSKFGGASGLFATGPELDYMEYTSDVPAQAAYVTSGVDFDYISQIVNNTQDVLGDEGGVEYRAAQSFLLSASTEIKSIAYKLNVNTGTPAGNHTIRIETDSTGPSGTLANPEASKIITPVASSENNATFATPFILASGTYWIVILCDNQANNNYWTIAQNSTSVYADGAYWFSSNGGSTWSVRSGDLYFIVRAPQLQSYSESTVKIQGSRSLKGIAAATSSLNKTLIRTLTSSAIMDLREQGAVSFYLYASRTGANIRLGLRNSSGVLATMQTAPYIVTVNSWHAINWNISTFAAGSRDNVDQIIFTIMEDSVINTFYVDSITSGIYKVINKNAFLTVSNNADWRGLGDKTIDNQINFNFVGTSQALIGQGSNSSNYWLLQYNTAGTNTSNGLYFQVYSAGVLTVNLSGIWSPNTGSWNHLELVRNTTNNWYMFVNGSNIFVSGTTAGIIPDFASLLKIGVNVVTTNNSYLHAFADEWRFSNNARHIAAFTSPTVAYHSDIIQERRLLCASGTGIYYSTDIGRNWTVIQTNRTAGINYFGFIKDYVINTNENYNPPQYWAGTAAQYFANISTAAPACKHSASHQGFAILLNESANKTGFYYIDQNEMFDKAWSNFKLPTARNDELTVGFSISRSLYVSSKYKLFRLNYIGGSPDWEYLEVKDWGFVPKTVKKINLPGVGETIIGLDWTKKIRVFFGADDEIISDHIARDNGITPFYLDNISSVDLNKCWAEDDKKAQVYRLFLVYGGSSTVSYCLNFNYRAGSWYADDTRPYQSGVLAADTADNLFMFGCDYNGRINVMDSGNTEAGVAINEYHISPFLYQQSPARVFKSQQINMFFTVNSSGTLYYEDRNQFSNVFNLRKTMTLANAISSIQIRHAVDIPESMNVYQFKLSSSANTADPWRCNLIDLSLSDLGGIGVS